MYLLNLPMITKQGNERRLLVNNHITSLQYSSSQRWSVHAISKLANMQCTKQQNSTFSPFSIFFEFYFVLYTYNIYLLQLSLFLLQFV